MLPCRSVYKKIERALRIMDVKAICLVEVKAMFDGYNAQTILAVILLLKIRSSLNCHGERKSHVLHVCM